MPCFLAKVLLARSQRCEGGLENVDLENTNAYAAILAAKDCGVSAGGKIGD
jgi:hypothetical protein